MMRDHASGAHQHAAAPRTPRTPSLAQVGNHNYGQLLDCFSTLDGPEKLEEHKADKDKEHKASFSNYGELKAKMAERCGLHAQILRFSETVSQARLLRIIGGLMADDCIHGILVELPLPQHLNEMEIMQAIGPSKDVDGLAFANLGRLLASGGYQSGAEPYSRPTVPMGVVELLLRSKAHIPRSPWPTVKCPFPCSPLHALIRADIHAHLAIQQGIA